MKIKTLLIGSGDFAIPIFKKALELDFLDIVGIVTQPDKPVGRKQEIQGSPVFEALKDSEIEVNTKETSRKLKWFKPVKFRAEHNQILEQTEPELVLVASYGQILPKEFIDYPKYKALNFHGSILPQLRGAVPVPMAILQNLPETGVTLQIMSEGMDEGDIVSIRKVNLNGNETTENLMSELAKLGVEILENDLQKYINGDILLIPQDNSKATYCYKSDIEKEKAEIKFETDILMSEKMIRAFNPWPVAYVMINSKMLKIFSAKIYSQHANESLKLNRIGKSLILDLNNGSLELLEIQLEGKQKRKAIDYLFLAD